MISSAAGCAMARRVRKRGYSGVPPKHSCCRINSEVNMRPQPGHSCRGLSVLDPDPASSSGMATGNQ